ncbi:caspase family protein [candidate division KSB1 bacterium]
MSKKYVLIALAVFLLSSFSTMTAQTRYYAVLAGINDYPLYEGDNVDLTDCLNDIASIQDFLETYQNWDYNGDFDVYEDDDVTDSDLVLAIRNMTRTSTTTCLFYFSGHGETDGVYTYDSSWSDRLTPAEVQSAMRYNNSTYNQFTVLIDACHSGVFPDNLTYGVNGSAVAIDEHAYENAYYDVDSLQHGYYTRALLKGLYSDTSDDGDPDGYVSAEELTDYGVNYTNHPYQTPQKDDNYLYIELDLEGNSLGIPQSFSISSPSQAGQHPNLSWSTLSGASYYKVYRKYGYSEDWTCVGTPSSPSFEDDGVTVGYETQTAWYRVKAYDSDGLSYPTDQKFYLADEPDAPTSFTCTNKESSFENPHFTWNTSALATSYNVFRKKSGDPSFTQIGDNITNTYYDDTSLYVEDMGGDTYYYYVTAENAAGESGASNQETVKCTAPEKRAGTGYGAIPKSFELSQNYPNPFNPVTEIQFALPRASQVTLIVYNLTGQEVARLVDEAKPAGYHTVKWDASRVASGTYIYKIVAGGFTDVKKMIVIK